MTEYLSPPRLDVKHAAESCVQLAGRDVLQNFSRLMADTQGLGGANVVQWSVRFETRAGATGQTQAWLYLQADLTLPLTCQRCLRAVDVSMQIDRWFKFVETEAQAEQEEDDFSEDVLVQSRDFDLLALIEDEVLMDLPVVPRHEVCPEPVKLVVADADFDVAADKPNPFAVLSQLKGGKKA